MLVTAVHKILQTAGLIAPGEHVLAGVSGGADSVALLAVLCRLAPQRPFRITVVHLNHRLRGRAAEDDAAFVAELADRFGLPFLQARRDVRRSAKRKGISLEMAAREARYAFFARSARSVQATVVATAHTADDQAETVLLNLLRGSGPAGLAGIPEQSTVSGLRVVRPLLRISRDQITAFLRREKLAWREDLSNRDVVFLRNRVRHELLPLLRTRFNPAIRATLCRTADILDAENEWIHARASERLAVYRAEANVLRLDGFRAESTAVRRRILRTWLAAAGIPGEQLTFDTIDRLDRLIGHGRGSGRVDLPGGRVARREYNRLCLDPRQPPFNAAPFRVRVAIPGETFWPDPPLRILASIAPGLCKDRGRGLGLPPACASIRRAAIGRHAVFVRRWRPGDRMAPLGMQGTRKLQDIFVDAKVPAPRRAEAPIFECAGQIVWIPGYRVARGWGIENPSIPALQLRLESLNGCSISKD